MDAKLNIAGWISEQMGGVRLGCSPFDCLYGLQLCLSTYYDCLLFLVWALVFRSSMLVQILQMLNFITQLASLAWVLFFFSSFTVIWNSSKPLSYRDPNLLKALDMYDETGDFLRHLEMDDDSLAKAITGTIGDVDSYQLPECQGLQ